MDIIFLVMIRVLVVQPGRRLRRSPPRASAPRASQSSPSRAGACGRAQPQPRPRSPPRPRPEVSQDEARAAGARGRPGQAHGVCHRRRRAARRPRQAGAQGGRGCGRQQLRQAHPGLWPSSPDRCSSSPPPRKTLREPGIPRELKCSGASPASAENSGAVPTLGQCEVRGGGGGRRRRSAEMEEMRRRSKEAAAAAASAEEPCTANPREPGRMQREKPVAARVGRPAARARARAAAPRHPGHNKCRYQLSDVFFVCCQNSVRDRDVFLDKLSKHVDKCNTRRRQVNLG
ncbi:Protein of unknown function [Gryllus bimaculatus]|nr:Protein of unknown function [Gryllus bimaculatus]